MYFISNYSNDPVFILTKNLGLTYKVCFTERRNSTFTHNHFGRTSIVRSLFALGLRSYVSERRVSRLQNSNNPLPRLPWECRREEDTGTNRSSAQVTIRDVLFPGNLKQALGKAGRRRSTRGGLFNLPPIKECGERTTRAGRQQRFDFSIISCAGDSVIVTRVRRYNQMGLTPYVRSRAGKLILSTQN